MRPPSRSKFIREAKQLDTSVCRLAAGNSSTTAPNPIVLLYRQCKCYPLVLDSQTCTKELSFVRTSSNIHEFSFLFSFCPITRVVMNRPELEDKYRSQKNQRDLLYVLTVRKLPEISLGHLVFLSVHDHFLCGRTEPQNCASAPPKLRG